MKRKEIIALLEDVSAELTKRENPGSILLGAYETQVVRFGAAAGIGYAAMLLSGELCQKNAQVSAEDIVRNTGFALAEELLKKALEEI